MTSLTVQNAPSNGVPNGHRGVTDPTERRLSTRTSPTRCTPRASDTIAVPRVPSGDEWSAAPTTRRFCSRGHGGQNPHWADRAGAVGSVVAIRTGVSLRPGCASFSSPTSTRRWPQLDWVVRAAPLRPRRPGRRPARPRLGRTPRCPFDRDPLPRGAHPGSGHVGDQRRQDDLTGPDAAGEPCVLWLRGARADDVATDGGSVELATRS